MCGHTYLCKSRHGVYYFRAAVPKAARAATGRREVRISLRTKDRKTAKILAALKALTMTHQLHHPEPWEIEDQDLRDRLMRGLALIAKHGKIDLTDRFAIDGLMEWLSVEEFKEYVFAIERQHTAEARFTTHSVVSGPALPPAHADAKPIVKIEKNSPAQTPTGNASDLAASGPDPSASPIPSNQSYHDVTAAPDAADEQIDKAIDRFVDSKKQATSAATADKYGAQCRLFLKIVANGRPGLHLSHLTAQDMRSYVDALPRLPTRIEGNDPRPLATILASSGPTLSPKTVFSHAQATNMFLAWCEAQQYPVRVKFHSILKPLLRKPKPPKKKKSFTPEHLKILFEAEAYTSGSFTRPSDYWVPLLGLFTGAREAELCQLVIADVRQDAPTGLWLLDINSDTDKKLKTDASAREVPLHPTLIELGFLEYVGNVKASGGGQLFPGEPRNKRGEFSAFSKRFNRYKEALGIRSDANNKLDFHSFRHTLQTMLFEAGEEEYVVNAICGHSPSQHSEGLRTYSRGPGLKAKYELLLKLSFPIDFTNLKANGFQIRTDTPC